MSIIDQVFGFVGSYDRFVADFTVDGEIDPRRYAEFDEQRAEHGERAVELIKVLEPLLFAVVGVRELGWDTWADTSTHFTCSEAEAIADFLDVIGAANREDFLRWHADDDEPGDLHFDLKERR